MTEPTIEFDELIAFIANETKLAHDTIELVLAAEVDFVTARHADDMVEHIASKTGVTAEDVEAILEAEMDFLDEAGL